MPPRIDVALSNSLLSRRRRQGAASNSRGAVDNDLDRAGDHRGAHGPGPDTHDGPVLTAIPCLECTMRVAIVGGPGIGKSTLVRQLGDLYRNGSYGEGEQGVWDPRVLADIDAARNPVGVTAYFARLYDANYRHAATHDEPRAVVLIEGAQITLEAHVAEYPPQVHGRLREVVSMGNGWQPDRTIVLTSGINTIEKHIRLRRRPHEEVERMVERFAIIDAEFRRLAPAYPGTIVVERDALEFHTREGLLAVIAAAGLPPFPEIAYEQMS